jgi:BirA family transcriptional regulator, biotin operon repressor / biotin---[acetyl-CoA-carboxylase] ligase
LRIENPESRIQNSEFRIQNSEAGFGDLEGILKRQFDTQWIGRDLRCFNEVDSTNRVALDLARAGVEEGAVVIADAQTRGRGRLKRSWVSPGGLNLYLSVVLHPGRDGCALSLLSIVAGVAVCDTVREWDSRAAIKWPNDVLIEKRKIAGILAELAGDAANQVVALGIGVNLNSTEEDFPPDLRQKAGSLFMATDARIDRGRFVARLLGHLERRCDELRRNGPDPVRAAWCERSCLTDRRVTVATPGGEITGRAIGLDEDGALRLQLDSGDQERVVVGDVTVLGWS